MTEITDSKMIKAKYSEAVIMFLRLKEAEEGPKAVHSKVIVDKAMTMVGLTHGDRAELTKKRKVPAEEQNVHFALQVLKHMKLIENSSRGYWGLTTKGRRSRVLHHEYMKAVDEERKQRK